MKFNFDWNCVAAGAPYITISELALGFNLPSISLLGNPEEVVVGFDEKTMTIGVKQDVYKRQVFKNWRAFP